MVSDTVTMLRALWGAEPCGLIQVWELQRKRLHQGRACEYADFFHGKPDIYTAVALAGKRCQTGRPRAQDAVALPGVWADIDIKPGAATDVADALRIAGSVLEPTMVIHTGGGLQAWWLLHEPWRFASRAQQARGATLTARWHARLTERVALDAVHDLARLMRLPDTLNAKQTPARPVLIISADGPRYTSAELWEAAGHPDIDVTTIGQGQGRDAVPGGVADVAALPLTDDLTERLELLLIQSPVFAAAWHHHHADALGRGHWSMSQWDMAVASWAGRGQGFSDQDVASIVRAHRLHWLPGDAKAQRADYLTRTVQRARSRRATQPGVTQPGVTAVAA